MLEPNVFLTFPEADLSALSSTIWVGRAPQPRHGYILRTRHSDKQ